VTEGKKEKRRCPICDAELDDDEDICSECGSYVDEPACDSEDDIGG